MSDKIADTIKRLKNIDKNIDKLEKENSRLRDDNKKLIDGLRRLANHKLRNVSAWSNVMANDAEKILKEIGVTE